MGNFLKTWFTVLRGREKLRNERLLVAFVFGAESVVLPPPQSTIRNLQLLEPFAKFASRWDLLPGRVVIPGSAGVPPAQDLAGSWRLASQGWSVHLPTGAGAAPLQECGRDARAPRGKPMAGQVQIRILQKAPLNVFLRGPSRTPFESLPAPWSPFADPLPDLWRIPLEPPPTPSWPFAVLRGPSWISFCLFVEILSSFGDPWQTPLELPPTP